MLSTEMSTRAAQALLGRHVSFFLLLSAESTALWKFVLEMFTAFITFLNAVGTI